MELNKLKAEYNYNLKRNANAEKYFKEHSPLECEKYIKLFNEVCINLSTLRYKIESLLNRKMTEDEILNGFKN